MSHYNECPDLETLFTGLAENSQEARAHLESCPVCAAIVEDHRQLEKDLLRLADPLPPPDFVHAVMAKVEAHPAPVRREVWTGIGIFAASLVAVVLSFVLDASAAGQVGTAIASGVVTLRNASMALFHGLGALWETSALPVTAVASALLVFFLFGLRSLGLTSDSRVTT
ncbi:MAG: hypothetical protein WBV82_05515 [Myxococcaceae bacterium]